jgi:hypothetical protein
MANRLTEKGGLLLCVGQDGPAWMDFATRLSANGAIFLFRRVSDFFANELPEKLTDWINRHAARVEQLVCDAGSLDPIHVREPGIPRIARQPLRLNGALNKYLSVNDRQPQQKDDSLGLIYFIAQVHSICMTVFFRRGFGIEAFGLPAVCALVLMLLLAGESRAMSGFLVLWLMPDEIGK